MAQNTNHPEESPPTPLIGGNPAAEDGSLRHALMEFFIKKIASNDLHLDDIKMKGMTRGETWDDLSAFLERKNDVNNSLGDYTRLDCRKKIKKLRSAIRRLSTLINEYGDITHIDAEVSLDIGKPIQLSESVQVRSGEIDAVVRLEDNAGRITLFVIDWKRSLHNKKSIEQYKRQCQVYVRAIRRHPSIVNLTEDEMRSIDIRSILVEIGGEDNIPPTILGVDLDEMEINRFLEIATNKMKSSEITPGHHCSSYCKWAFAEYYCDDIKHGDLEVDLHSDHFWDNLGFASQWIYSLTQFSTITQTKIEPGGENVILFDKGRELHLRNVNFHITIPLGKIVRMEGSITRKSPKMAIMSIKMMKLLD